MTIEPSVEQIEADIARTREELAQTVGGAVVAAVVAIVVWRRRR